MHRLLLLLSLALAACASGDPAPEATAPADALAMSAIDASGGWDAWAALPLLRFDWFVERDTLEIVRVHHLWDRAGQRVRVEWEVGDDSVAVAIVDLATSTPEAPVAMAYVNGEPSAPTDSLEAQAYARFINDSYWLLAPLKTLDPGANREIVPDSAQEGSKVLRLSFGNVGLTPGDQYWLRIGDKGEFQTWTYQLEGDTTRTMWAWSDPVDVAGPAGPVTFLTRKSKPDGTSIVTLPSTDAPEGAWTSPLPLFR